MGYFKKQVWDESVKDTPEYDIRKLDLKIARLKKRIEALKGKLKCQK